MAMASFWIWISWFMAAGDVLSATLPFTAFLVTHDWRRAFDCFSLNSMLSDLGMAAVKLAMMIGVAGADKCVVSINSTTAACSLTCAGVFFYFSHKSVHGVFPQVLRWSWAILAVHLVGVSLVFAGQQFPNWQVGVDKANGFVFFAVVAGGLQAGVPIFQRVASTGFTTDEPAVKLLKAVANILGMVTAAYDLAMGRTGLPISKGRWYRMMTMPITTLVAGSIQLGVRAMDEWPGFKDWCHHIATGSSWCCGCCRDSTNAAVDIVIV